MSPDIRFRPANSNLVHVEREGIILCGTVITGAVFRDSGLVVTCPGCLAELRPHTMHDPEGITYGPCECGATAAACDATQLGCCASCGHPEASCQECERPD